MAKIKVIRDNVVLSIEQEELAQYEAKGFCKLGASQKAPSKDLQKEINKISKENEKLKSENEKLKVEKEELLNKVEELEKAQVEEEEKEDKNEK